MELGEQERYFTIVGAERDFRMVMLQDDDDGELIIARAWEKSPYSLGDIFKVKYAHELIGRTVKANLLNKKIYPEDGNGKVKFARYNFQPI